MPRFPLVLVPLILLAFSAAATIVTGPEVPLAPPIIEPAAFFQGFGRMATDGDGFLAVWHDRAAGTGAIHAARLRSDGTRIDETPLVVAPAETAHVIAAVAFDGARYLVVWSRFTGIYGRFIAPDGAMAEPFRISDPNAHHVSHNGPRVAFNGRVYLVAWPMYGPSSAYGAAIVDPRGHVSKHVDFGHSLPVDDTFALASANGLFHLVTRQYEPAATPVPHPPMSAGVTVIAEDGSVTPRIIIGPVESHVRDLLGASGPGHALVAWKAEGGIRAVQITGTGIGAVESLTTTMDLQAIVADRSGYLVMHGDGFVQRAWRAGTTETFAISGPPAVAIVRDGATGSEGTVLISETTPLNDMAADLYVHRLHDSRFEPLVTAHRHQSSPEIAAAGTRRLAVWWEWIAAKRHSVIAAARIDGDSRVLDDAAIEIAGHTGFPSPRPRVASNGSQWLVVWVDGWEIRGARVSRGGAVLGAPITIATNIYYNTDVEVVWDGLSYVVVYGTGFVTRISVSMNILATRVSAEGDVRSPQIMLSSNGPYFWPAVAVSPAGSLITWTDTKNGLVQGALLSHADSVTPIAFPSAFRASGSTAAGWNGETFLVVSSVLDGGLYWTFVSTNGVVTPAPLGASLPATRRTNDLHSAIEVEPAADGFLLTFLDATAIRAAMINGAGYVAEPPAIVAEPARGEQTFGASGKMIVYARHTNRDHDRLSRVVVRNLETVPNPPKRRAVR